MSIVVAVVVGVVVVAVLAVVVRVAVVALVAGCSLNKWFVVLRLLW